MLYTVAPGGFQQDDAEISYMLFKAHASSVWIKEWRWTKGVVGPGLAWLGSGSGAVELGEALTGCGFGPS